MENSNSATAHVKARHSKAVSKKTVPERQWREVGFAFKEFTKELGVFKTEFVSNFAYGKWRGR
jgi:hypothetical protein